MQAKIQLALIWVFIKRNETLLVKRTITFGLPKYKNYL